MCLAQGHPDGFKELLFFVFVLLFVGLWFLGSCPCLLSNKAKSACPDPSTTLFPPPFHCPAHNTNMRHISKTNNAYIGVF